MTSNLVAIYKRISEFQKIVITGHLRPDGDCVGSVVGLATILKTTFPAKDIRISLEESVSFSHLYTLSLIEDDFFKESLAIVCDVSDIKRISEKRILDAKDVVIIDHHLNEPSFNSLNYIDSTASSTSELIYCFAIANSLPISLSAANAILTGIITDTGWYHFTSSASPFLATADLIKCGADPKSVARNLPKETFSTLKFKGYLLSHIEMTTAGFIYLIITKDLLDRFQISREEAGSALSLIDNIENNEIYGLFIEDESEVRIRLRSHNLNIVPLANKYSGGGHKNACGCSIPDFSKLSDFLADVDQFLLNC